MKASKECKECLSQLADQVAKLSAQQISLRRKIRRHMERALIRITKHTVPTDISNELHHIAKVLSSNLDPYKEIKQKEMTVAKEIYTKLKIGDTLRSRVEIAAFGNAIDYFVDPNELHQIFNSPVKFAKDDIEELARKLRKTRRILYLPDNAGEVFFDIPLVDYLRERADIFYAVKAEPIQNDFSIEELGFLDGIKIPATIIKGPPTVGVYLSQAPIEFRMAFDVSDLIIAKGMANYETLSELAGEDRVFYILRAKCKPVAKSLGVRVGDYIATFLTR